MKTTRFLIPLALVFGLCSCRTTTAPSLETIQKLDRDLTTLATESLHRGAGSPTRGPRSPSGPDDLSVVERLLSQLRMTLASVPEEERSAFFEEIPQGLRAWSGSSRREEHYLRDGILSAHIYVPDAIDSNRDRDDLIRNLAMLAELRAVTSPANVQTLRKVSASPPKTGAYVFSDPEDLHESLARRLRNPTDDSWITVLQVVLPYSIDHEHGPIRRARSYALYVRDGTELVGFDVVDADEAATVPPASVAGGAGRALTAPFRFLSSLNDTLFLHEVRGVPVGAPINFVVHVGFNLLIVAKETVAEAIKIPVAPLASLIATDRSGLRMWKSAIQPIDNIGHIWKYHAETIYRTGAFVSPSQSAPYYQRNYPVVGNYFAHYFDDPWTLQSEAPPLGNYAAPGATAPSPETREAVHVFVSRGIQGRGAGDQGNDAWVSHTRTLLGQDNQRKAGLSGGDSRYRVVESPYPWGTVLDPVFSLLNLSHGYAYGMANEILDDLPAGDRPDIVALIGHSGGVQRVTMASRFLHRRDVFTDAIYGVAGPCSGYAPTGPGRYLQVLSKSEFRDADVTSQISTGIGKIEDLVLTVLDIPVVGLSWWVSYISRGIPQTYKNVDVVRIEGRKSTLHRNPGMLDAPLRGPGLTFFRDDLAAFLIEARLLREAYARHRNGPVE